MRSFLIFTLLFVALTVQAQSGRANLPNSEDKTLEKPAPIPAQQLFIEANTYARKKFAEFEAKKMPYSEKLRLQIVREQKQLAAKNAAVLLARNDLTSDDFYYLGMLHWIAENTDGSAEALKKFVAAEKPEVNKLQASRAILTIIAARKKSFDEAEKLLNEYLNTDPVLPGERARMESEMAAAYRSESNFAKAAAHAEESYRAFKAGFQTATSRAAGLNDLLNSGMTVFEIYRDAKQPEKAEKALEDLQKTAAFVESTGIYYNAVNERVKFLIETGRKTAATQFYKDSLKNALIDFKTKVWQDDILLRLNGRAKHYEILGAPAPEFTEVDKWLSGAAKKVSDFRGKVVLLDFWATWCGPCFTVFPQITELKRKFEKDGLVVLGVTRYYGSGGGVEFKDDAAEFEYLKKFQQEENLPFEIVVGKYRENQINYGATSLPTMVIIDRQGIIRYVESGTGKEAEMIRTVEKLLAEK